MIHFHRWSRWLKVTLVTTYPHLGRRDVVDGQERVCRRCGKIERREITA